MRFTGRKVSLVTYPMGGLGAGMISLKGTGGFTDVSLYHRYIRHYEPYIYAALHLRGSKQTFVLEGTQYTRDLLQRPGTSRGLGWLTCGLPRFRTSRFSDRFPFGTVELEDKRYPVRVWITGWSPFIPGDADNSSLPVCGLEYKLTNDSKEKLTAVFALNMANCMNEAWHGAPGRIAGRMGRILDGLSMESRHTSPEGHITMAGLFARIDRPDVKVNPLWYRGGLLHDSKMIAWRDLANGDFFHRDTLPAGDSCPSEGGTLSWEFTLNPGESVTIPVQYAWYVPVSQENTILDVPQSGKSFKECYQPWYAGRFNSLDDVAGYWRKHYASLRRKTLNLTDALYENDLPREVVDSVAVNLLIFKTPVVFRQKDGRIWSYEGCTDNGGCCPGTPSHVWLFNQAIAHLFPELERELREMELNVAQYKDGFQNFRFDLPLGKPKRRYELAAADGQLAGLMKLYREWRIDGRKTFVERLFPRAKQSLEYCIRTWDPDGLGVLMEPHHNTHDIEFWGVDGLCSTLYLGALKAMFLIAEELGDSDAALYRELYLKGRRYLEKELFNGEYFFQKVIWKGLHAGEPQNFDSIFGGKYFAESRKLLDAEGPRYQYGKGCLSGDLLGAWLAECCGLGEILDPVKVKSHLLSVFKYNFRKDFYDHVNVQRSAFALGGDSGLLMASWPHGGRPSITPYTDEVWTGVEYQVASHLLRFNCRREALQILRAIRKRYNGDTRNPYCELECGAYYIRALASYALIQGISGVRYDAVAKTWIVETASHWSGRSFFAAGKKSGILEVRNGTVTGLKRTRHCVTSGTVCSVKRCFEGGKSL